MYFPDKFNAFFTVLQSSVIASGDNFGLNSLETV